MADNSVAMQVQVPQQQTTQNLLQTAMNMQKAKQAFGNSSLANPVKPTAFSTGGSDD